MSNASGAAAVPDPKPLDVIAAEKIVALGQNALMPALSAILDMHLYNHLRISVSVTRVQLERGMTGDLHLGVTTVASVEVSGLAKQMMPVMALVPLGGGDDVLRALRSALSPPVVDTRPIAMDPRLVKGI